MMTTKVEVHGKTLEAKKGDITDYDGDAIVNAANNNFWMGGGVAGAIKRKGGTSIEQDAMRLGPKPVGEAVITHGGKLKTQFVIHAAVMGQDLQTDSGKILSATRSALKLAESNKIKSIAFPALGTGVGGFPLPEAAAIMVTEAASFLIHAESLSVITFTLFDEEAYEIFAK
ncbi:MAG: macro domain-containing protein, partial [Candidatus Kryptoniota bacterium]